MTGLVLEKELKRFNLKNENVEMRMSKDDKHFRIFLLEKNVYGNNDFFPRLRLGQNVIGRSRWKSENNNNNKERTILTIESIIQVVWRLE